MSMVVRGCAYDIAREKEKRTFDTSSTTVPLKGVHSAYLMSKSPSDSRKSLKLRRRQSKEDN